MDILTLDERDRRWKRIRETMEERALECLIVWGSFGFHRSLGANLKYLSNVTTEGYLVFPLESDPTVIGFLKRIDPESWIPDWRSGHPSYSKAISQRLKELRLESTSIGIVGLSGYYGEWGFPYTTYMALMNNFPKANFKDATDVLEDARRIKSAAEIKCLELGCQIGDKVIQTIVDTANVGVRNYEIRAKIMDTLFREGAEPGSMVLYCQGKELNHAGKGGYVKPPDTHALEHCDVILTEFDARYLGYMAQYNQPFSVGEPNKEWEDIFSVALQAHNNGFNILKPGITAGELDEAFISPIKEAGYTYTHPAFHGLGLSLEEPLGSFPSQPEYEPNTSLRIEAGMVLEFEPQVVSLDGKKGLHIGSPVVVTETGCKLLSKTWKPEFKIVYVD